MIHFHTKKTSIGLIHKVYLAYLKNTRKYTASTKTKSEVAGGGKKPWKQKGTGQARAGSIRSPLWVGGGVIFGPKPRKVYKKINKKEKKLAIRSALFLKKEDLIFIKDQIFDELISSSKTNTIAKFLAKLGLDNRTKLLFILPNPSKSFWLATRNLCNVEVSLSNNLNIELFLNTRAIILSNSSLELLYKTYGQF